MLLRVFLISIADCYYPALINGLISLLLFSTLINEIKKFTSLATYGNGARAKAGPRGRPSKTGKND